VEVPLDVLKRTQIEPLKIRSADRYQHLHIQPVKGGQQKTYSF
jgi:hypothetical protein